MAKFAPEYLHQRFLLDKATGELFWKHFDECPKKWNTRWAGKKAGSLNKQQGYIDICIDNEHCRAHSVVWAMVKGYWPEVEIDHRDGARNNNKPGNLREATKAEQRQNAGLRSDSTSGYTGVKFDKRRQTWVAELFAYKQRHYLGQFDTSELAHEAYKDAKRKLHVFEPKARA